MLFIKDLIEFAERINIREVRLLRLICHGRAEEHWREIGITESEYRKAVFNVIQKKNKLRITASGIADKLPCRYGKTIGMCPAGKEIIYITKEGYIYPCASVKKKNEYKIGNIKDEDLEMKLQLLQRKINQGMLCVAI